MSSEALIRFVESNYYDLVDKFLELKYIRDEWERFTYDEYANQIEGGEL